ncbi:MAG TPA: GDSL-type esterase/lipase family protein [Chthoniobacterales bacterium]|jgi:lysophospholipase L1-like esterase
MKLLRSELFVFFVVLGSLVGCCAKPAAPTEPPPKIRVACVGDSITQGVGAERGRSYPAQLQELLGKHWEVGNFGVSGRTLLRKGDHPYLKERAFKKAQAFNPNVVIIMLGTNDTKIGNWRYKADFAKDYSDLIKTFLALKTRPKVYICRPIPVFGNGLGAINEAALQEQMPILDQLAQQLPVGIIDMHAALAGHAETVPDNVHPSTEGAALMARAASKVLLKAFSATQIAAEKAAP